MAGTKAPSGSLRAHASTAEKARSGGVFKGFKPASNAPKFRKNEFVGDDSGSSSSSSSSDSDSDSDSSDIKKEDAADFKKRISQTPSSKTKTTPAKAATPAKSPTVNGLNASAKKVVPATIVKKEDTSSSETSESGSDSEASGSSSDEEDTKASAKGKQAQQAKSAPKPKAESSSESESESSSESESDHAKKSKAKVDKKAVAQPKSGTKPAKEDTTSEPSSSSEESESESEAEDGSEDAEVQIAQQIRNDVQSAKTAKAKAPASSSEATRKSKAKVKAKSPSPSEDDNDDGDVEMVDQPMALTNGGSPTKVGSVPEFVAPDFHLRKLEGDVDASDVAGFFEKAKTEGKQVWYITAPASLPVTVVQDLTIPMDQAQKGLPVLSHNGDDYRMAFDNPSASSSFRLLIPNKKGDEYSMLERPVNQTMHFTRSETFPAEGPARITTTQTVATTKPARPQPKGLKARYTPLGVPSPRPTIAPPASSKKNKAAAISSTQDSSPKKKRKHGNDGENGPAATTPAHKESPGKNNNAEKPAKKQKTSNGQEQAPAAQPGRKETPVPLPPQVNGGSGVKPSATKPKPKPKPKSTPVVPSASQPAPASRKKSASPGAPLPSSTQLLPSKQTPIPIPIPKPAHVVDLTGSASSSDTKKERKKKDKKEEEDKAAKTANKLDRGSFEEAVANVARTPKKVTPILPPRFGGK